MIFLGMCFQQIFSQHWPPCLLEWRSQYLQLPRLLQAVAFHLQRRRVLGPRCHWWLSVHGTWEWKQEEFTPSATNRRCMWESSPGNRARGILGRQLPECQKCWRVHGLELSIPDLRGRSATSTGLKPVKTTSSLPNLEKLHVKLLIKQNQNSEG